jgi:hypothetical protein
MQKVKTVSALLLCCLPVWGISMLAVYTVCYFLNGWHSPPLSLTWWEAALNALPGVLGLFLGIITITYWKQR